MNPRIFGLMTGIVSSLCRGRGQFASVWQELKKALDEVYGGIAAPKDIFVLVSLSVFMVLLFSASWLVNFFCEKSQKISV